MANDLKRHESTQSLGDADKSAALGQASETGGRPPPPTITEEEERQNAGLHEYLESRDMELTDADVITIRRYFLKPPSN